MPPPSAPTSRDLDTLRRDLQQEIARLDRVIEQINRTFTSAHREDTRMEGRITALERAAGGGREQQQVNNQVAELVRKVTALERQNKR